MTLLGKTQVISARVEFFDQILRVPMQLSSGVIDAVTEARATVRVRVGDCEAEGRGSIYLSDLWAWPDPLRSHEERDAILRDRCRTTARDLRDFTSSAAHPLELGLRLHDTVCASDDTIPALAGAMCAAPFDAAIHDAAGQALGVSAFSFYDENLPIPAADGLFTEGTCAAIRGTLRPPVDSLEGCWIANASDDLDGEFATALKERGFYRVKIKLLGKDLAADARRTSDVYRAAIRHGVSAPRLNVDSNEAHNNPGEVVDYLRLLEACDPEAFDALDYLEQPTSRNIQACDFDWSAVSARKPVMLDEGLTSLDLLPLALRQGWSGLALKTCKGHSFILVVAAWAREHGLRLTMQDLTNPGFAAIHSYLVAARLPLLGGIELNSPQFTPQANAPWLPRLAGLFEVRDGRHRLCVDAVGLGSSL